MRLGQAKEYKNRNIFLQGRLVRDLRKVLYNVQANGQLSSPLGIQ